MLETKLIKIVSKKNILNKKINKLISDFEKDTNTKVLTIDKKKKPFEVAVLIDADDI